MNVNAQEHGKGAEEAHVEKVITVTVNTKYHVNFTVNKANGLQIKQTALAQGVPNIGLDFLVFQLKGHDHQDSVGDDEVITIHPNQEFRIIADDDNS